MPPVAASREEHWGNAPGRGLALSDDVNWLLRHNFWLVKLFGLLIITGLVANTTTTVLAVYLMSQVTERQTPQEDEEAEEESTQAPVLASRARRAERAGERILGRNVFCPSCGPTPSTPLDGGQSVPTTEDDLSRARRSQLPLVVAATMEHVDPSRSLATLVDTEHGVGGLFGVGDALSDRVELLRVAPGVVHIVNDGVLEYIPFDGLPPAPARGTPAATPAKEPRKKKDRSIEGAQEAIKCSEKGDCVVEREFVEKLFTNPQLLVGQGGASPSKAKDGSPGFRLRGVKQGTLPDLLGLRNGDVITEVGGSPLTMDAVAGLYSKLRHASHVEVMVDRRGERMRRQLEIRS